MDATTKLRNLKISFKSSLREGGSLRKNKKYSTTQYHNNKRIIYDENNLSGLFQRARHFENAKNNEFETERHQERFRKAVFYEIDYESISDVIESKHQKNQNQNGYFHYESSEKCSSNRAKSYDSILDYSSINNDCNVLYNSESSGINNYRNYNSKLLKDIDVRASSESIFKSSEVSFLNFDDELRNIDLRAFNSAPRLYDNRSNGDNSASKPCEKDRPNGDNSEYLYFDLQRNYSTNSSNRLEHSTREYKFRENEKTVFRSEYMLEKSKEYYDNSWQPRDGSGRQPREMYDSNIDSDDKHLSFLKETVKQNESSELNEYKHPEYVSNEEEEKLAIGQKIKHLDKEYISNKTVRNKEEEKEKEEKEEAEKKNRKHSVSKNHGKYLKITLNGNMNYLNIENRYQSNFKLDQNAEVGYISYDDGYSSETTRTTNSNSSAASENQNGNLNDSMIFHSMNDINFGSSDINTQDIRMSDTSNLHELLNAETEKQSIEEKSKEEERERRKNIQSKLETLLKDKVKILNSRTLPSKKDLKFPDPLTMEASRTLPSKIYHSSNQDSQSSVVYRHDDRKHYEPVARPLSQTLIYNGNEEKNALVNKESMLSELKKSIVGRSTGNVNKEETISADTKKTTFTNDLFMDLPTELSNTPPQKNEIDLYDSFPLYLPPQNLPKKQISEQPVDEIEIEKTDEAPINKQAVVSMLKSHLKVIETSNNNILPAVVAKPNLENKFSFISIDVKTEDISNDRQSVEHSVVFGNDEVDDLFQRKLSLESDKPEESILESASFKRNRSDTVNQNDSAVFGFSLTSSEYESIRKQSDSIKPDAKAIIEMESKKSDDVTNSEKSFVVLIPEANNILINEEKEMFSHLETNTNLAAVLPKEELNNRVNTEENNVNTWFNQRPEIVRETSLTEYYLPEENNESVIKPSDYQIHKFSDRKTFTEKQLTDGPFVGNIQINRPRIITTRKAANSIIPVTSQIPLTNQIPTIGTDVKSNSTDLLDDAMIDNYRHRTAVLNADISKPVSNNKTKVLKRYIIARSKSADSLNEKWSNQPYINMDVGKVNIPTSFQTDLTGSKRSPVVIQRQLPLTENTTLKPDLKENITLRTNMKDISPRPSTPKKIRRFSFTKDKTDSMESQSVTPRSTNSGTSTPRSTGSQSIGNKIKTFFSPTFKRKSKKRNSFDEYMSTDKDDITRRMNINSTWGFDDNIGTVNGGSNIDNDDNIDVDFISNKEWLNSQKGSIRKQNQTRPAIKEQMLPGEHSIRKNQTIKSNTSMRAIRGIGKVVVPDVFSDHNERFGAIKFGISRSRRPVISTIRMEENNKNNNRDSIEFIANDAVFNSLDVNKDE